MNIRALVYKTHKSLAWLAFSALLLWGLSGLLHPLMSAFGVQQAVFAPPRRALDMSQSLPLQDILRQAGIAQAQAVRVVVSTPANLLQVTTTQHAPRRYFALDDGHEIVEHDAAHAEFVARHYLGLLGPENKVSKVEWIDQFSNEYPSVNRLLPVYKVSFDRPDQLTAWVYTETNSLAAVSDSRKAAMQTLFQWVHTWSFMPTSLEWPRVAVIGAWVGLLAGTGLGGLFMLLAIRRRVEPKRAKSWHRAGGWVLSVPLIALAGSGVYHLFQYAGTQSPPVLALQQPIPLDQLKFKLPPEWKSITQGLPVNGLSLVQSPQGELVIRLGLANTNTPEPLSANALRNARFDGITPTGPAVYLKADSGQVWAEGDRELAIGLALKHTGAPKEAILDTELVTRFGGLYDFRNKRLPVWRIDLGAPVNGSVFIDTNSGALVDITADSAKLERWSFSVLHKWNFLQAFGRNTQNIVVSVAVLGMLIFFAALGFRLKRAR